jgi:DUF1680 family protein
VRSAVAVEAGPIVYCVESVDLPAGHDVNTLRVTPGAFETSDAGSILVSTSDVFEPEEPDRATALIPYYQWANRGLSTMRVWMPVTPEALVSK